MDELLEELSNEGAWAAGIVLSTPKIETLVEGVAALRAEHAALTEENGRLREACRLVDSAADHGEACEECQDEGGCEIGMNLWGDAMVAVRAALAAATPSGAGEQE